MLEDLIGTIQTLRDRIKEHRSYFGEAAPEVRTRVSLIDPLLQALEWDVGDPNMVEIEPKVANGRADYGLRSPVGAPLLLLEAKKLADTKAPYKQIASYVVGENLKGTNKIRYCATTNGSRWQVFDVFAQEPVLDVSLERDDPWRCALKLLALWQVTLREGTVVEPVRDLASASSGERPSDSGREPWKDSAGLLPNPGPLSAAESGDWTPLDSKQLSLTNTPGPREMRFPDDSRSETGSWRDVLIFTANWLYEEGLLTKGEMPFTVGGRWLGVSLDGRRPDGKEFGRSLPVGQTGIKLEGQLSAKNTVRFAIELLKRYGKVPSEVRLRFERTSAGT